MASRANSTASMCGWLGAAAAATAAWQLWRRWPRYSLRGRVAVVTGGVRGLGYLIARELLDQGCLVAVCARLEHEVREATQALSAHGIVQGVVCDVTDHEDVQRLVADVESFLGPVDVLVNNAGEMMVGPLEHMTKQDFHRAMRLHYGGALNTTYAVLPSMRARRQGRIVNIASIGGLVPIPHMAPYVASKFALVGMSRAMRAELGNQGIAVVTVCPGPLRTGSQLGATFKGRNADEFAWFAGSGSLPLMSTSAERAARRVVQAVRSGEPMVLIGLPAHLGRIADGVVPGVATGLFGLVDRYVLPESGGIGERAAIGAESTAELEDTVLLERVRDAADELQSKPFHP